MACGTCCQGVYVEVTEDEAQRVTRLGAELGVERPVQDGGLRFQGGRCVFLGEDMLCRLHGAYGMDSKPLTCRQFPYVSTGTESGVRTGVDPSCAHAWQSWKTGPELVPEPSVHTRKRHMHPSHLPLEDRLLAALSVPGLTVAGALNLLAGGAPGQVLPRGFAGRLVRRLAAADVAAWVSDDQTGNGVRRALAHLPAAIAGWSADQPPEWPVLTREQEDWALEAVRRMLHLRLAPTIPAVPAVALLSLCGAVATGWANPAPAVWGPAYAAWLRSVRVRAFWQALAPDPATMQWLGSG